MKKPAAHLIGVVLAAALLAGCVTGRTETPIMPWLKRVDTEYRHVEMYGSGGRSSVSHTLVKRGLFWRKDDSIGHVIVVDSDTVVARITPGAAEVSSVGVLTSENRTPRIICERVRTCSMMEGERFVDCQGYGAIPVPGNPVASGSDSQLLYRRMSLDGKVLGGAYVSPPDIEWQFDLDHGPDFYDEAGQLYYVVSKERPGADWQHKSRDFALRVLVGGQFQIIKPPQQPKGNSLDPAFWSAVAKKKLRLPSGLCSKRLGPFQTELPPPVR